MPDTARLRLLAPALWGVAVGALSGLQGLWAFLSPRSWFDALAVFEPFNKHFIRDIGTFQVGLAVAGILGALRRRAVVVGLGTLATFQVLHVASHIIDRDAGGRPGFDISALSLLAAATVVALVFAWRAPADRVDA